MEAAVLIGEHVLVPERIILAPAAGLFRPLPPKTVTTEGEIVYEGQSVGIVTSSGTPHDVTSPFSGFLMGILAHPGERVREGQPVAWLRTAAA
jgi:multidrug efflux pump subunit AcrA (membrane-fusion protein)